MEPTNPSPETLNQPVETPEVGGNEPQTIPYARFQEVIDQKNQFKTALEQQQQQAQYMQQYILEHMPQESQPQPAVDPDFWNGADQNPNAWIQSKLAPALNVSATVKAELDAFKQELVQQSQYAQAQQQAQVSVQRIAEKYPQFRDPVAQQSLISVAQYLNTHPATPDSYTLDQVFDLAAQRSMEIFGQVPTQSGRFVAENGGNLVQPTDNTYAGKLQAAREAKDVTALARLHLENLDKIKR